MSRIEHLFENAITAIGDDISFKEYKESWSTQSMAEGVNATLEEIWMLAEYVVYTLCQYCDKIEIDQEE